MITLYRVVKEVSTGLYSAKALFMSYGEAEAYVELNGGGREYTIEHVYDVPTNTAYDLFTPYRE